MFIRNIKLNVIKSYGYVNYNLFKFNYYKDDKYDCGKIRRK